MTPVFTPEEFDFIVDAVKASAGSEQREFAESIHTKLDMMRCVVSDDDAPAEGITCGDDGCEICFGPEVQS